MSYPYGIEFFRYTISIVQVKDDMRVEARAQMVCRVDPATGRMVCDITGYKNAPNDYRVVTGRMEFNLGELERLEELQSASQGSKIAYRPLSMLPGF